MPPPGYPTLSLCGVAYSLRTQHRCTMATEMQGSTLARLAHLCTRKTGRRNLQGEFGHLVRIVVTQLGLPWLVGWLMGAHNIHTHTHIFKVYLHTQRYKKYTHYHAGTQTHNYTDSYPVLANQKWH